MNPDRLLEHFHRLAEAPGAIPRLRRFVLDLAVRGKLVEQDPNDEPASELLKRIAIERKRLGKGRQLLAPEAQRESSVQLTVGGIPRGWLRASAEALLLFVTSGSRGWASYYSDEGAIFLRIGNLDYDTTDLDLADIQHVSPPDGAEGSRTRVEAGDILISITGDTGMIGLVPEGLPPAYINQHIALLRPSGLLCQRYLATLFMSPMGRGQLKGAQRGIKNSLGLNDIRRIVVPVPPLAEQHRIVAKVDELMALCDRLETAQAERERRRDRVVVAAFHGLSYATEPNEAQPLTHLCLRNLPRFTTRTDQIPALRQTILNLAVRGKLVPQDPSDEPASELLKRISAEKRRSGNFLHSNGFESPAEDSSKLRTHALPIGWREVVVEELALFVTSGSRGWASYYSNEGAIFLRIGNLDYDTTDLDLADIQHVSPPDGAEGSRTRVEVGDILVSITGDIGMIGLVPEDLPAAYINQHIALLRPSRLLCQRYLATLLMSPLGRGQLKGAQRGIKNSLGLNDIRRITVPLPPLAEQHRIVAKVDELMAVCDQLESQLTNTHDTRRRLLEAVLQEALAA